MFENTVLTFALEKKIIKESDVMRSESSNEVGANAWKINADFGISIWNM